MRLGPSARKDTCSTCLGSTFEAADACWPHARARFAEMSATARAPLTAKLAERFQALATELREFVRKSDWNNRHEARGAEQDSWLRGLHALAGASTAELGEPAARQIDPGSRSTPIANWFRRAWRKIRPPRPVVLDLAGIKLEAALQRPGCVICAMAADSLRRWLFMLLWEGVMDPEVRGRIRAVDGFCSPHWWQLHDVERQELHSVGAIAILAEDILGSLAEQMRANRLPAGPCTSTCLACRSYRRGEDAALSGAGRHLQRPEFRAAYFASHGPCTVHRGALAARVGEPRLTTAVIEHRFVEAVS